MRFGAHVSIAGGVDRAVDRAVEAGCDTFQIFTKSARQWAARELDDEEVQAFRDKRREHGVDPAVAHASYLLNLASGDDELRERSWRTGALELELCRRLGLAGLVLHPGSHLGDGVETGLGRVARGLEKMIEAGNGVPPVLLEVTAGQGTGLGAELEHLAWLVERLGDERIGVCLDSCHLHAAGYALDTEEGCAETLERIEEAIGFERVAAIHLNDSKTEAGSRVDRHAHIGEGTIGAEGFAALLSDPRVRRLPGILETPPGDDWAWTRIDLARLRALARGKAMPPLPDELLAEVEEGRDG